MYSCKKKYGNYFAKIFLDVKQFYNSGSLVNSQENTPYSVTIR
jgi:hypothetical protein